MTAQDTARQNASDGAGAKEVKACCAGLYSSDWARLLVGDSLHPGGLALTERLGDLLGLGRGDRVLDVASGRGDSAVRLAERSGCEVLGIDYSARNVAEAEAAAARAGVGDLARFAVGDAERLPLTSGSFDAVICECAFCTFVDKPAAASEFHRLLRPGGRVGLSDLTRNATLPPELGGLLAWVACIADARPVDEYIGYLGGAGLSVERVEPHDAALGELVETIRSRLLGAELLVKLKKLELPGVDFAEAKRLARSAAEAVRVGRLGYTLIVGAKST